MFKKKVTTVPLENGDVMQITLKGTALLHAIDAGLVQETADGRGYNIGPFLKFWENFSRLLPAELKEGPDDLPNILEMIQKQGNQGADK